MQIKRAENGRKTDADALPAGQGRSEGAHAHRGASVRRAVPAATWLASEIRRDGNHRGDDRVPKGPDHDREGIDREQGAPRPGRYRRRSAGAELARCSASTFRTSGASRPGARANVQVAAVPWLRTAPTQALPIAQLGIIENAYVTRARR